jgi:hypothetical protein
MCTFGDFYEPDLQIYNPHKKYTDSTSELGHSYELPEGKNKDWFTGSRKF